MNGYETIKEIIYKQLVAANANIPIGRNKFSKDLAKRIYELLEPEMNKSWNLAHEFPLEMEKVVRRFENALGILLKRTEEAKKIYEFVLEQEKQGRKFERFAAWAKHPDRRNYLPKYFSKPEYIQVDYQLAFMENEMNVTKNEDGSLYV